MGSPTPKLMRDGGRATSGWSRNGGVATRAYLQDVLNALPEHDRDAVVLRDVRQLPYTEVADRLQINLNTAKSRVARGRTLLAGMLAGR